MPIPLGILAVAGAGAVGGPSDYELIATTVLSSNQSSVTFSSLGDYAATYQHLQIRLVARSAVSATFGSMHIGLNGITTTSYASHELAGQGSSVSSSAFINDTKMPLVIQITGSNNEANNFGVAVVDILDPFNSSKNTTIRSLTGRAAGSNPRIALFSGFLNNTASVTSIELIGNSADIVQNSRFSLYGLR